MLDRASGWSLADQSWPRQRASIETSGDLRCLRRATVHDRRVETAAVFELIVAAGHGRRSATVVALYNGLLDEVLMRYTGRAANAMNGAVRARPVAGAVGQRVTG